MMSVSATKALAGRAQAIADTSQTPRLSTDVLNRYSEALMLLEMTPADASIIDDLKAWRGIGYRAHFEASALRCAPAALAAYDRLDPARRAGFEELCAAMSRLVATATALLSEAPAAADGEAIVSVAGGALRKLIGRATQFINANGEIDIGAFEDRSLQAAIDALLVR